MNIIEVDLERTRFPVGRYIPTEIRLHNCGQGVCTSIRLTLDIPPSVQCIGRTCPLSVDRLEAGQTFSEPVKICVLDKGSICISTSSFSYRDHLDRMVYCDDVQLKLRGVIEKSASEAAVAPKSPTPVASSKRSGESELSPTYDVFISHASEDKDAIARPLYGALVAKGVSVWFDEATLELGDSLRRKIDDGLARCRYGIVILSPRFLAKEWPQRELEGLLARETASGAKAILPVWHDLDAATLLKCSPTLADKLAARSSEGVTAVVEKILRVLKK